MAQLIITRPDIHWFWQAVYTRRLLSFGILIDGQRVASIGPGERIELTLLAGRHRVKAGSRYFGSQPLVIDVTREETRHLAVGKSVRWQKLNGFVGGLMVLSSHPMLGLSTWRQNQGPQRMLATVNMPGFEVVSLFIALVPLLAALFLISITVGSGNDTINLIEIPDPGFTEEQVADALKSPPAHLRFTIRHLMIAVAVLALMLATASLLARHLISSGFRASADMHTELEALFRRSEGALASSCRRTRKSGNQTGRLSQAGGQGRRKSGLLQSDHPQI